MASVFNDPLERAFAEERGDMYYSRDHLYQKGQEHMEQQPNEAKQGELTASSGVIVRRILGHKVEAGKAKEMLDTATRATAAAIKRQGWMMDIKGKNYVTAEGWSYLATNFFELSSRVESVQKIDEHSWLAWCQIMDADGNERSRACALCSDQERTWKNADEYARLSMAQTRAMGKAYRMILSQVMCMAGFEATPYEEMPQDQPKRKRTAKPTAKPDDEKLPF